MLVYTKTKICLVVSSNNFAQLSTFKLEGWLEIEWSLRVSKLKSNGEGKETSPFEISFLPVGCLVDV